MPKTTDTATRFGNRPVDVSEMEAQILRWLASGSETDETSIAEVSAPLSDGKHSRTALLDQLDSYTFQNPNHQLLFDCLRPIAHRNLETIRDLLPSRLVRAGFPDVGLDPLYRGESVSNERAGKLIVRLVGIAGDFPRRTH